MVPPNAPINEPDMLPLLLLSLSLVTSRPVPTSRDAQMNQISNTWQAFDRLIDAERGSLVAGVAELKRYFSRFGYLPVTANFTDAFDDSLEAAVNLYQSKLGLPVTGRLDAKTMSLVMSPRCGVSDSAGPRRKTFAFFPGQPRWTRGRRMTLSYSLSPFDTINYIPRPEIRAVLRRALDRWSQVIPVNFVEAGDYESADVKLAFYSGDHGDGEPFDGKLGVLAHAFSPESGRLHFDAAEQWSVDLQREDSDVAVDLESVATHEIGHVLGLAHSSVKEAVMYPSLSPRTTKTELRVDDVQGVQSLYGSNPDFKFSSLLESDAYSSSSSFRRSKICSSNGGWNSVLTLLMLVMILG